MESGQTKRMSLDRSRMDTQLGRHRIPFASTFVVACRVENVQPGQQVLEPDRAVASEGAMPVFPERGPMTTAEIGELENGAWWNT